MLIIRRLNFIDAASGIVTLSKWPSGAQVERELRSSSLSQPLRLAKQSQFIPLQNVVYFIMLPVL